MTPELHAKVANLESLNSRLEGIMLRHRELDALKLDSEKEIHAARSLAEQRIAELKSSFGEKLQEQNALRSGLRKERDSFEFQAREYAAENEKLIKSLEIERNRRIDSDTRAKEVSAELSDVSLEATKLENANKRMEVELEKLRKSHAEFELQSREARQAASDSMSAEKEWKAKAISFEKRYNEAKETYGKDSKSLREEILKLRESDVQLEARLKEEYGRQLASIVEERQGIYDKDKETLVEELRASYDDKIEALRKEASDLRKSMAKAAGDLKRKSTDLEMAQSNLDDYAEMNAVLERRVNELNGVVEELRKAPGKETEKLQADIKTLEKTIERKDRAYEELMDLKIRLDQQIQTFRRIMDEEESRLGEPSDGLLRKRPRVVPKPAPAPQPEPVPVRRSSVPQTPSPGKVHVKQSPVIRSSPSKTKTVKLSVDLAGDFFKVANVSNKTIRLRNYTLNTRHGRLQFEFPDMQLEPKTSVKVWIGEGNAHRRQFLTDLYWADSIFQQKQKEEEILLYNNKNKLVDGILVELPKDVC